MKRRLKFKIYGESPRSLFLAFVLAKVRCDVYIYNFLGNSNSKKDYQIFIITNTLKNLLNKLDSWNEIEDICYGFTSLVIKDNFLSQQILLRTENFPKKCSNTIGWTVNYSDIKTLLINKLINLSNVHFISNKQLIDKSLMFDYEFDFESNNKKFNLFQTPLSTIKRKDEKILMFNAYLRGHVDKRLYEINTTKGLLVLTPLNKNLYQVIWNNPSSQIKEISLISKSFFLDNLTTLLPNELKIDQIIGDIKILYINNSYSNYILKNKYIYFNENKFISNTIYNFNFDIVIRSILQICNFIEKNDTRNTYILNIFGFYHLFRKCIEVKIKISFSNTLFYLFTVNNLFSLFLRKLSFALFKRISLIKKIIMRNQNISNINNLLK